MDATDSLVEALDALKALGNAELDLRVAMGAMDRPVEEAWDALKAIRKAKLDDWSQIIFFHWILDRGHLRRPGIAPLDSERWRAEADPAKLRERKLTPASVFADCARLSKVKIADRLSAGLRLELDREWRWHWAPKTPSDQNGHRTRMQLRKLARLSSDLNDVLQPGRLYYSAEKALLFALMTKHTHYPDDDDGPPPPPSRQDLARLVSAISSFAIAAADAARLEWGQSLPPRGRGRPNRNGWAPIGPGNLKQLVLRILWDVRAADGYLTLNKNNLSGTLIEVLTLLRPHLPAGLVPNVLPGTTLARMAALDQKIAAASQ